MTVAETEHAIGAKLTPFVEGDSKECWLTGRADGRDAEISYMIDGERVVRIDIYHKKNQPLPDFATAANIRIGSTEEDIKKAYGPSIKINPAPYYPEGKSPVGHDLIVEAHNGKSAILFETEDFKVHHFRVGFHGPLEYIEGCD